MNSDSSFFEPQRHDADDDEQQQQIDEYSHRKRLALILRYIASMHQSLNQPASDAGDGSTGLSLNFVQPLDKIRRYHQYHHYHHHFRHSNTNRKDPIQLAAACSDFFQHETAIAEESAAGNTNPRGGGVILFGMNDFRHLIAMEQQSHASDGDAAAGLLQPAPFNFYAAAATSSSSTSRRQVASRRQNRQTNSNNNNNSNNKRTLAGSLKDSLLSRTSSPTRSTSNAKKTTTSQQQQQPPDGKACWLRMTRMTNAQIGPVPRDLMTPAVVDYLEDWLGSDAAAAASPAAGAASATAAASRPQERSGRTARRSTNETIIDRLLERLTLRRLEQAPKPSPSSTVRGRRQIKHFLRQYRYYLYKKTYQQQLEPVYNRLFEWIQLAGAADHHHQQELVWGLGQARQLLLVSSNDDDDNDEEDAVMINGPLLEVHMEVELARDGALLVRPREHTGVTLNRQVVAAIMKQSQQYASAATAAGGVDGGVGGTATAAASTTSTTGTTGGMSLSQQLYQTVAELEPSQLSPGQPNTYMALLKRMARELSPTGSFQLSSSSSSSLLSDQDPTKLVVTEAWCLYCRPKPSSVWARDALAFADAIQKDVKSPRAAAAVGNMSIAAAWGGNKRKKSSGAQQQQPFCLPSAAWSITHGPGILEKVQETAWLQQQERAAQEENGNTAGWMDWMVEQTKLLTGQTTTAKNSKSGSLDDDEDGVDDDFLTKPLFPLPTSAAQNRIADLLLNRQYPAVVCEGPPGTGKTHSIANLICAYLCQGKRVLVTSKNAPALSVLRNRLPASVRQLCVDVSMSELSGMRQLQKTVERLADRICSVSSVVETEKCRYLRQNIRQLEQELAAIDEQLLERIDQSCQIVGQSRGQKLIEQSLFILQSAPWITKQLLKWTAQELSSLTARVALLVADDAGGDAMMHHHHYQEVSGYTLPISDALLSLVASRAGSALGVVQNSAQHALAALPVVGSGFKDRLAAVQDMLAQVQINGVAPSSKSEWVTVLVALKHAKEVHLFQEEVWKPFERRGEWPKRNFCENVDQLKELHTVLVHASEVKDLTHSLNVNDEISAAIEARTLDARRGIIVSRIQTLSEELVDCTVVMELSRSFSAEAQSSLIRFAQIAGKAKFSRTSQPSKMSQRQRRRRQEYLEAFDRCCRFIPCWILTTSQISDYLPSECLFDLVICDESSQSEAVSVLPGMLRGKQWLIVGDTKQVSPTDCFVSEDQIDSLRASLPPSPFSSSLLPGQSFFDLCAQAFPRGRVVLSEHFRCAEEIIAFSNQQFYDGRLIPLRLPKKSERLKPAVLSVKVQDGVKTGKVNEKEADEIVQRIEAIVSPGGRATAENSNPKPRSIGVISLIGEEQSRLIRGRLLDVIGGQLMSRHDILVGDPPTFQGAERDIIFLSMVASPGSVPTQSQLMHFQRANVALSRARDQCVLVRSIEMKDIPSMEDVKVPILEFFDEEGAEDGESDGDSFADTSFGLNQTCAIQGQLRKSLEQRGFVVRGMGVVWKNGLCVEHLDSDNRAALMIEGAGESKQQWQGSYAQQKAIERVGWQCLRVDALSLLVRFDSTFEAILKFLATCGVEEPAILYDELDSDNDDNAEQQNQADHIGEGDNEAEGDAEAADNQSRQGDGEDQNNAANQPNNAANEQDIVVISSNDEEEEKSNIACGDSTKDPVDFIRPDLAPSGPLDDPRNDDIDASNFGQVVDMGFLGGGNAFEPDEPMPPAKRPTRKNSDEYQADEESDNASYGNRSSNSRPRKQRRTGYRRLEKYQRDGRWYPAGARKSNDDPDGRESDWYDTDSDLTPPQQKRKKRPNDDDGSWYEDRKPGASDSD